MKVKLSQIKKSIEFRNIINSKTYFEVALKTSKEIIYSLDASKAFQTYGLNTLDFLKSLEGDWTYYKEILNKYGNTIEQSMFYGCKKETTIPENILIVDAKEIWKDYRFRCKVVKAKAEIEVIVGWDFGDTFLGKEMKEYICYG